MVHFYARPRVNRGGCLGSGCFLAFAVIVSTAVSAATLAVGVWVVVLVLRAMSVL